MFFFSTVNINLKMFLPLAGQIDTFYQKKHIPVSFYKSMKSGFSSPLCSKKHFLMISAPVHAWRLPFLFLFLKGHLSIKQILQ